VSEPCARKAPRQAADRAAAAVDQPGLPRQLVAARHDAYDEAAAAPQPARSHHHQVRGVTEDLQDVLAQPPGRHAGVQLGLDHDPAADQMQASGEPQDR
jgi:hypothetical protein